MNVTLPCDRLLHDDQKESGLLPVLGRLLKTYSFRHQPRSHAAEVVQAIHITLRLLERLSRQGNPPPLDPPPPPPPPFPRHSPFFILTSLPRYCHTTQHLLEHLSRQAPYPPSLVPAPC